MNKIIASVGLVALGAANIQAQTTQTPITGPAAKWWNVQATVRGFYDDNINAAHNPGSSDRVWGFEVNPKVGVSLGNDQTSFTADYAYALLYYDKRPSGNTEKYDQNHTFNLALNHAFNERYALHVRDSFVIGQEPDALRRDAAFHTPFRVPGDNMVNSGAIDFDAELTPLLGLEIGYGNAWFDYKDEFSGFALGTKNVSPTGDITPSLSGALDRIEHLPHLALLYHVAPDTTASLGYRFAQVSYTGNEFIGGNVIDLPALPRSEDRNNRSHTAYIGVDHQFRPDFYGSIQGGVSYYDYYNLDQTKFGPYGRLSLTYVYMQDSFLQVGFQEGRSPTDVVGGTTKADLVRDTEASVLFANVRQRIVPNLFGNLNGSWQHSVFQGGGVTFNDKAENFYEFGANLEYQFNPHFSAHAGYDFDHLDSEIGGRSYTRNKIYIGATASY
jgi:hypothetical protein